MEVVAIVFSALLFLLSLVFIVVRIEAAPCAAFLGMLVISMGKTPEGYPLLPLSNATILGWLFMAVLVTVLTLCQPAALRHTRRGIYYYLVAAITGMALGLLAFTVTSAPGGRYAIMICAVAVATFIGALMFANTPQGKGVSVRSGNFFTYMLAKGFPTAISVMQLGTVLIVAGL